MPRYALIKGGVFSSVREYPTQPGNIPHKSVVWLPCPEVQKPAYDATSEKLVGPTFQIGETEVTESWSVVSLTSEELSAAKDSAVASINGNFNPLLKILRNHENRLRLLENSEFATNKPALSLAEVRAAIKAIL